MSALTTGTDHVRLSVESARQLLDFQGGGISPITAHAAEEQLHGAVALHNILHDTGFAYLADEVGMGKTYVALGALALFRHFDPTFRALVIAPRQNIQKKWVKELRNFTARNVRFPDLRVSAMQGDPSRATVLCKSILELARETAADPDRDFFARLSSFSFALGAGSSSAWEDKRNKLRKHVPWLDPSLFSLRNKEEFKDNFARGVNCALPAFDLVIFDEGHNLKHGRHSGAASRNRMLSLAFGHPAERDESRSLGFKGFGPRAKRVLFLSATPIETDYVQLWNQLDIFGFGKSVEALRDKEASDEEKHACAARFLIRRVTTLPVAGEDLTKNHYRREWRGGGVDTHDDALTIPDDMQRLTVALVQKKVSEILGNAKFKNSFQIGMLASFESFLETARPKPKANDSSDQTNFDGVDQAELPDERLGIDIRSVNGLARSYRRQFGRELPHPKMDAVVRRLESSFTTGEKALVFVRRIASVNELRRKLETLYDEYLFARLRSEIKKEALPAVEGLIARYIEERTTDALRRSAEPATPATDGDEEEETFSEAPSDDEGGNETFFAWFFRGEGPKGRTLSGAALQRRFSQPGAFHSIFFDDNHVAALLGVRPGGVTRALTDYLARDIIDVQSELERRARALLPPSKKQARQKLFLAFQAAAVAMLAEHDGSLRAHAKVVLEERYQHGDLTSLGAREIAPLEDWLETATFWTSLREREELCRELWPSSGDVDFRRAFVEAELRRELLSAMVRLGHPFIDLYVLSLNRLSRPEQGAKELESEDGRGLAAEFLDLLEGQRAQTDRYSSYRELRDAAESFNLILAVNEPGVRGARLDEATTLFGRLLRAQQPVGGMSGKVNETLIRQFRMPGYPLVLITTDLLQEGEDLHTFCSSVYHYGISWMPSSMEQRVGRVDRVSSQTDRRLTRKAERPAEDELLQVYYPHLSDTVEVLQVRRVMERLNRFMRLMHEDLGGPEDSERRLHVATEVLRPPQEIAQFRGPLKTAFPIRSEMLLGEDRPLAVTMDQAQELAARFASLEGNEAIGRGITWDDRAGNHALFGTMSLRWRQQPFTLFLRTVDGRPAVRCVSPVGVLPDIERVQDAIKVATRGSGVRVGAVHNQSLASYNLTIEDDVLLGERSSDVSRVARLLSKVAQAADSLEEQLLGTDHPMSEFREDLGLEISYER